MGCQTSIHCLGLCVVLLRKNQSCNIGCMFLKVTWIEFISGSIVYQNCTKINRCFGVECVKFQTLMSVERVNASTDVAPTNQGVSIVFVRPGSMSRQMEPCALIRTNARRLECAPMVFVSTWMAALNVSAITGLNYLQLDLLVLVSLFVIFF